MQVFKLDFDQETFERINKSTLNGHGETLQQIAQHTPGDALSLLHRLFEDYHDIDPVNIEVKTNVGTVSSQEDGLSAAFGTFMYEVDQNLLGSMTIEPAEVVMSFFVPNQTRSRFIDWLNGGQPQVLQHGFTISVDPPAMAM